MSISTFSTDASGATQSSAITQSRFVGLQDADLPVLLVLIAQLNDKRSRNELRRRYYDQHNTLKDLGISIPPALQSVEVIAGWPAKAVDTLSRRNVLERMVSPAGGAELASVIEQIWDANRLDADIPAAHTSALIHSCAFVFVHAGDASMGEPPVLVTVRSAEDATGIWSKRLRTLTAALSVSDVDVKTGKPTLMNLYLPGRVVTLARTSDDVFEASEQWHGMGVPVEMLSYKSDLDRPFGRSRITRAVMYNTDAAMRTMLRTEVGAEFYNAPQRYALGADEDAFEDASGNPVPAWTVMLGRLLTLSRDEDGNLPTVGQFSQQTMQPNIDQLKVIAQMEASETSVAVESLGIVQDNPTSAEAIRARNEELGLEIEHWQRTALTPAWRRVMLRAVAMATDSSAALVEARTLRPVWGSWSAPSEVSQAQAALSRVQAIPALAETDVELERMGYTEGEIERIQAQWRKARSSTMLSTLTAAAPDTSGQVMDAAETKAAADAMGVLIRAGVEPTDAAARVGLSGVRFTGATPSSLRLPTADAALLEGP